MSVPKNPCVYSTLGLFSTIGLLAPKLVSTAMGVGEGSAVRNVLKLDWIFTSLGFVNV